MERHKLQEVDGGQHPARHICHNTLTIVLMKLYSEDDKFHAPIATFKKSQSKRASGKANTDYKPAELVLSPRAMEIQDLVVLTLLFQEKQQRTMASGFMRTLQTAVVGEALAVSGGAGADI